MRRGLVWTAAALGVVGLGAGGWFAIVRPLVVTTAVAAPADPARAEPKARRPGGPAAPAVRVAEAVTADLPVTLDGLGTVQAFHSVTVASQVDGRLVKLNFREGQQVQAGDLLAQIDPRSYQAQLDQALAKLAQNQAQLQNAKRDLERYRSLSQQNYASAQQVDTARAQMLQFEGAVRGDEAAVANARVLLSYTTITAPISGRLGLRQVDAGNIVRASDPNGIVTITQIQPINVVFTLPQQRLPELVTKMGQGRPLTVAALAADGAVLDRGTVEVIDNQIDTTTGTVKLKAVFPNTATTLWPGGFVNVRLQTDVLAGAVVVPTAAVQFGPDGAFVFVVKEDLTVAMRPVAPRHTEGDRTALARGLEPGERVVTGGQDRLRNGVAVTISGGPRSGG